MSPGIFFIPHVMLLYGYFTTNLIDGDVIHMDKIKKILLVVFSLFLISNINQAVAADFDFSEEAQQMLDAKNSLKLESVRLAEKYPELAALILDVNSKMNDSVSYTEVMQFLRIFLSAAFLRSTVVSPEKKEQDLSALIQIFDKQMNEMRVYRDLSYTEFLALLPAEEVMDFFRLSLKFPLDIYEMGKQNLEAQLSKVKENLAIKQEL